MLLKKLKSSTKCNSVIIGAGEVGRALFFSLITHYQVFCFDKKYQPCKATYLHICFPYSKDFVREVKKYQRIYKPKYTIVHSTVPVGTSRKCGAIHSPVRGIHPFLQEGLKTFIKYLGGEKASEVADYFRRAGFRVYLFDKPETTELMKILSTTFYGTCIEFTKEVKRLCQKYKVPFEAWTIWTKDYNEGYKKLGFPEFQRPNLVPIMKKTGGHCVRPNYQLLKSKFTNFLKKL